MNAAALQADMEKAIQRLASMHAQAVSTVAGTSSFFGASNSKAAAEGALRQYGAQLEQLRGPDRDAVLAQQASPSWWWNKAKLIGDGIAYTVQQVGDWGLGSVASKWAGASWEDVKAITPSQGQLGGVLVLVVLGLLAVATIQVVGAVRG